jgi:ubiquitin carboxyl-terminal hydrolase 25/28
LQLYKTDAPAVRPDEELAYLAITRPEVDQIVEPDPPVSSSMIDDLPTVGSPSSTCVNTPSNSRPSSPLRRSVSASRSSILGKRISQDRDTSESPGDRPKKSDGFERLREETPPSDPFEMVERPDDVQATPVQRESTPPSSATDASSVPSSAIGPDIEGLRLKSPAIESSNPMETYAPPPGPPPLPPRPRRASKGTLNAGLKFGEWFRGRQSTDCQVYSKTLPRS